MINISKLITKKTFTLVVTAFLSSVILTCVFLNMMAKNEAYRMVELNAMDVCIDIWDDTNEYYSTIYQKYSSIAEEKGSEAALKEFIDKGFSGLYITDAEGNIINSDDPKMIGKSMKDLGDVLIRLYGEMNSFDEATGPIDSQVFFTEDTAPNFSGIECYYFLYPEKGRKSCLATGVDIDTFSKRMALEGQYVALNRRVGSDGFDILLDKESRIVSMPDFRHYMEKFPEEKVITDFENGIRTSEISRSRSNTTDADYVVGRGTVNFDNVPYFYAIATTGYYYVLSLYPFSEAYAGMWSTLLLMFVMEIIIFIVLFLRLNKLISREVVDKLKDVNQVLGKISDGNLDEKVEVRNTIEFESLSTFINSTVASLKKYIAEAEARIDADLALAREIQYSALPNVFPPYPEHDEFELFASMDAAKEVGGDFYDYSLLNGRTLNFLIADVSGKSIPGAMFMMRAKSVIKSLIESGLPVNEVLTAANDRLSTDNDAKMFVTAWLGSMDISTGEISFCDAGHNPPILIRDGKAEFIRQTPDLILGFMEGVPYSSQSLKLEKGDILFLYTDGAPEAKNKDEQFYGNNRLLKTLSVKEQDLPAHPSGTTAAICQRLTEDLSQFYDGEEHFDDITMLCIRYNGKKEDA